MFNEENNKEAGEHWTPCDAVKLLAKLIFLSIAAEIKSGPPALQRHLQHGPCAHGDEAYGKQVATTSRQKSMSRPTPSISPIPLTGTSQPSSRSATKLTSPRYFYKPQPLHSLEEICADILVLAKEIAGLLGEILGGSSDE